MSIADALAAAMARLLGSGGAILGLHGIVADGTGEIGSMHLTVSEFERVVSAMRDLGEIVPLPELLQRLSRDRATQGLIALTADDAYASLGLLAPVLEAQQIPLTVFAVSGALQNPVPFWWDRLEACARGTSVSLWNQFLQAAGVPESFRIGHRASGSMTRPVRQWLLAAHAGRLPPEAAAALNGLEAALQQPTRQRSMGSSELAAFLRRTRAILGVHTVTHAALPFLPDSELRDEVRESFLALSEEFPDVIPVLAVPFGLYDERTLRIARDAGMSSSLTLEGAAVVEPTTPNHAVHRFGLMHGMSAGLLMLKTSRAGSWIERLRRGGSAHSPFPVLPSSTS